MAITRATGFPVSSSTSATSVSVTWATANDLAIINPQNYSNSTVTVTGVSSSKVTGWTQAIDATDSTDAWTNNIWYGRVSSAGADTVTITYSGTTPASFEVDADELVSSTPANVWSVVTSGSLRTTATPWNFPSLTSNTATLQAYWGLQIYSGSGSTGSGTGFTFTLDANLQLYAFDGTLAASTAFQPAGTGASGNGFAAAVIFQSVPSGGGTSEPDLVMAPMRGSY